MDGVSASLSRWLVASVAVLLALDVAGGVIAIESGVNTAAEAWSAQARLAAPWPMMLLQLVTTLLAVRAPRRFAIAGAGLLSAACLISGISGFFDGGFRASELDRWHVAFQVVLISWTWVIGLLAASLAYGLVTRARPEAEPAGSP